jgi:hypothetical protein
MNMNQYTELLLYPDRLYTALDVGCRPCPVPPRPGVYAWYFDEPPTWCVDTTACHQVDDRYLLYVGISPKAPSLNGKPPSRSTLRQRIRTHYFVLRDRHSDERWDAFLARTSASRFGAWEAVVGTHSPIPASKYWTDG